MVYTGEIYLDILLFLFSIAIYLSTDDYLSPDDLDLLYETSEFASKLLKQGALPGETITVRDLAGTMHLTSSGANCLRSLGYQANSWSFRQN